MNSRKQIDMEILDFTKAFDKVPYLRFLRTLEYYGISGTTLDWIQDFVRDRTQTVNFEGLNSAYSTVYSGVRQGSVLGLILFLV